MLVDGVSSAQGGMALTDLRQLPTSLDAGKGVVTQTGAHTITVAVTLGGGMSSSDENIESFSPGASFAPLVVVIFFAATTHMVRSGAFAYAFFVLTALLILCISPQTNGKRLNLLSAWESLQVLAWWQARSQKAFA